MDRASQALKTVKIVTLAVSFLLLLFHFTLGSNEKSVSQISSPQIQGVSEASSGSPVRLTIPAIKVDAAVEYVGVTSQGDMDVPSNSVDVGWYKLGRNPGEPGSAVMAGHFDSKKGEPGVFNNLDTLQPGNKIYVKDENGMTITFVVRESRRYNPDTDAVDVFGSNDGTAHLNLITCDGAWNEIENSYSHRLVVFADQEIESGQ